MIGEAFEHHRDSNSTLGPNAEANAFRKWIEDGGQPIYPGCEEFSKLSFVVEMYNLKCLNGVSDREHLMPM